MKSYLVKAYESSPDSLYSRVLFQNLASLIDQNNIQKPKILDLGCADGRGRRLLKSYLKQDFEYFGVDIEKNFKPDLVADIRDIDLIFQRTQFQPNIIFLNDVLEHFDNGRKDIEHFLAQLTMYTPKNTLIYITVPQLYRLDTFKLPHLYYAEHRVRFNSIEWASLIGKKLEIKKARAASFITATPHLIMASRHYSETNTLGKTFHFIRRKMNNSKLLEKLDNHWVNAWGENPLLLPASNGIIFECINR